MRFTAFKVLMIAQLREQPGRLLITVIAIALGVALSSAVYLVNEAALNEFGLATKRLVGEADVIVRGPREGFDEQIFVELARNPAVSVASPILELEVAIAGRSDTLKVLGLDPFRAASVQPALLADLGPRLFEALTPDAIFLSDSAAQRLHLKPGSTLVAMVANSPKPLRVIGLLSASAYPQAIGLMDIAAAQWTLGKLGAINRIDLQLAPGTDVAAFRRELQTRLPAGVLAVAPQVERDRAVSVTRAYRLNLNMLALVALWTGAFLVFSTQSLAVLRRRRVLALLRALGVTRGELQYALIGEGAALGVAGSLLGVMGGAALAALILRVLAGDLGTGQLRAAGASLITAPGAMVGFFVFGSAVAALGGWFPARAAARQAPARALKGGNSDFRAAAGHGWRAGLVLLAMGAVLAFAPAIAGLPLFGYLAIGLLLLGAVLLVPSLTVLLLRGVPRTSHPVLDTAIAQMRQNVGQSTLSLASIIVSFSLMVAMAIMVYSFRISFDHWLGKLLPADLQLREPFDNDTAYWSPQDQTRIASLAGVARVEFRRTRQLLLNAERVPVTLIARGANSAETAAQLPLLSNASSAPSEDQRPIWISESLRDLYGYQLGESVTLPLRDPGPYVVAGIWRDYARPSGSIVMSRDAYLRATGDANASEASLWLKDPADAAGVEQRLRTQIPGAAALEIITSSALRERSLRIFDRAFVITYAIEAIAVFIGLLAISFAASSAALARRAEFGMLRHLGMLRRQTIALLASEGVLTSVFGVLYGLMLGFALSLVLVYVVNRQSFNWSIDLAVPAWELAALSAVLVAAAALTALISGRAAVSQDAVRAVREDW